MRVEDVLYVRLVRCGFNRELECGCDALVVNSDGMNELMYKNFGQRTWRLRCRFWADHHILTCERSEVFHVGQRLSYTSAVICGRCKKLYLVHSSHDFSSN